MVDLSADALNIAKNLLELTQADKIVWGKNNWESNNCRCADNSHIKTREKSTYFTYGVENLKGCDTMYTVFETRPIKTSLVLTGKLFKKTKEIEEIGEPIYSLVVSKVALAAPENVELTEACKALFVECQAQEIREQARRQQVKLARALEVLADIKINGAKPQAERC